jgi:hypothetical protein
MITMLVLLIVVILSVLKLILVNMKMSSVMMAMHVLKILVVLNLGVFSMIFLLNVSPLINAMKPLAIKNLDVF